MKSEEIKDKKGVVLKTEEGKVLMKHTLEPGDEFIPQKNRIYERKNEADIDGKKKTITNHSIKAKVKDKNGSNITQDGEDNIFVNITPTQAISLQKKIDNGLDLNQNLFITYEYESKEYGTCIGVGLKDTTIPKDFKDFDK